MISRRLFMSFDFFRFFFYSLTRKFVHLRVTELYEARGRQAQTFSRKMSRRPWSAEQPIFHQNLPENNREETTTHNLWKLQLEEITPGEYLTQ